MQNSTFTIRTDGIIVTAWQGRKRIYKISSLPKLVRILYDDVSADILSSEPRLPSFLNQGGHKYNGYKVYTDEWGNVCVEVNVEGKSRNHPLVIDENSRIYYVAESVLDYDKWFETAITKRLLTMKEYEGLRVMGTLASDSVVFGRLGYLHKRYRIYRCRGDGTEIKGRGQRWNSYNPTQFKYMLYEAITGKHDERSSFKQKIGDNAKAYPFQFEYKFTLNPYFVLGRTVLTNLRVNGRRVDLSYCPLLEKALGLPVTNATFAGGTVFTKTPEQLLTDFNHYCKVVNEADNAWVSILSSSEIKTDHTIDVVAHVRARLTPEQVFQMVEGLHMHNGGDGRAWSLRGTLWGETGSTELYTDHHDNPYVEFVFEDGTTKTRRLRKSETGLVLPCQPYDPPWLPAKTKAETTTTPKPVRELKAGDVLQTSSGPAVVAKPMETSQPSLLDSFPTIDDIKQEDVDNFLDTVVENNDLQWLLRDNSHEWNIGFFGVDLDLTGIYKPEITTSSNFNSLFTTPISEQDVNTPTKLAKLVRDIGNKAVLLSLGFGFNLTPDKLMVRVTGMTMLKSEAPADFARDIRNKSGSGKYEVGNGKPDIIFIRGGRNRAWFGNTCFNLGNREVSAAFIEFLRSIENVK